MSPAARTSFFEHTFSSNKNNSVLESLMDKTPEKHLFDIITLVQLLDYCVSLAYTAVFKLLLSLVCFVFFCGCFGFL